MPDPIELAPDYYLSNFIKLIDHAREWYPDLLTTEEHKWLYDFEQLDRKAQCLLVRLLSRKGDWFRSDKLNYTEIGDTAPYLESLDHNGFVTVNSDICANTLARELLTKPEICTLFAIPHKSTRKEQLLDQVPVTLFTRFDEISFVVIHLQQARVIDVLLALFFANTHQDLSQFVLDDLGLHQFERYQLSKVRRFFSTRCELNQLLHLSELHSRYSESDRKNPHCLVNLLNEIDIPITHSYIERKRQQLVNDIARDLERVGDFEQSLKWYNTTTLPPSRERQARLYDKLDNVTAMSDVVASIISHPYNISELEVANKLAQRVKRKQGQRIPRKAKFKVSEHRLELGLSQQRVELAAKSHYEQQGYQVFYSENVLLNGLFGLAFWKVIFAPIEGAFVNRYQHRPLDLYHRDFFAKRQLLFAETFQSIEQSGLSGLHSTYKEKYGLANPFVHWTEFSPDLLKACIKHIPTQVALALFKVMLQDLKLYRSGMPDLILFKKGQFEWVEVKGPGDKLQDNQRRWIKEFLRLDILVSVAFVNHCKD
ncbi:VRR-NUC domain-containing protein [Vibrio bivalvicida]|uniref:phosphodiesterase I n=1 Tax=Vibrio bivalvicida TaxID=1276888 RepID=A0ABV4MH53_9VIBR